MTNEEVGMQIITITEDAITEDPEEMYINTADIHSTMLGSDDLTAIEIKTNAGHQGIGSFYAKIEIDTGQNVFPL